MNTKKDFEATARIIRAARDAARKLEDEGGDTATIKGWLACAGSIAEAFTAQYKADNPRFNEPLFFAACGLYEGNEGV